VELSYSKAVQCDYSAREGLQPGAIRKVYVEADGELVGTLPAEISILPDALTLLGPRKQS
jgi:diacylglycerol kinase family enzyme